MTMSVSPAVVDRGPGDPEIAVVGGVHGDEPSGVSAVRTLAGEAGKLTRGVRFVLANPPAYTADQRFLDTDMNRAFPGDPDGNTREARLAAQLCEITADLPTLSLHSTHAQPEPIALAALDRDIAELAAQLPVQAVVDETTLIDGSYTDCSPVVTVEVGIQQSQRAHETALTQARAFLTAAGAYDDSIPDSEPEFYRLDAEIEKPAAEEYELLAENFKQVSAGEEFATAGGDSLVASESFVPILASECGYDDVFGYRGTHLGSTLDAARESTE